MQFYDWIMIYDFKYTVVYIPYCVCSTVKSSLDGQNKLIVHAPRDGTAAGRHGGAPREHSIFFMKTVPGFVSFVSFVLDLV